MSNATPGPSSVSYFVRYAGLAQPHDAFLRHYRDVHAPILKDFPGLAGLRLHVPADWRDPAGVTPGGADFMAEMVFPDVETFQAALASEARVRARTDFANLPVGGAAVTHQAMTTDLLL